MLVSPAIDGFIGQVQMFSKGSRQKRQRLLLGSVICGGDEGQSLIERLCGRREKDFKEGTGMDTFSRYSNIAIGPNIFAS